MLQSLRRWGGRWAQAPVIAVTPRFGPPLAPQTRQALERLQVEHLSFQAPNPYAWKAFLNKHYALAAVEERSTSPWIGWLDSDLLITDEPDQLFLEPGMDFRACPADGIGATTGPGDPMENYWREVCQVVGIEIEALPWVTTEVENSKVRIYFNSGVFIYRRSTGLSQQHLANTLKLFDARLASQVTGTYFTQHLLGITVAQMGLSWGCLPHSHNYSTGSKKYPQWYIPEKLRSAKILHYHNAMWPSFWPTFLQCMQDTHPAVATWLASIGPMQNHAALPARLFNRSLKFLRERKSSAYSASCSVL
ncbi:MAG: hypothetical protein HC835_15565 [Oscillatoriales cyanobacterium RM2_1_1]|nr:hypothetical protein [Oscillatoriales cyanobacterium SM2_3_0]NJO46918.1 hypothetical protein [Oscillatoriales cyanobacterium RM2_1_1]